MSDIKKEQGAEASAAKANTTAAPKSNLNEIYLSNSPHFVSPVNTQRLMLNVVIALLPVAVFSVYLYGLQALLRLVTSVASTVFFESAFRTIIKRPVRAKDRRRFRRQRRVLTATARR